MSDAPSHIEYANIRFPPPMEPRKRVAYAVAMSVLWGCLALVIIAGISVTFAIVAGPLSVMVTLLTIFGIVVAAKTVANVRRRRARSVLAYVEQAVRLNLPLPRMLLAAQEAEHGPLKMRLWHVRELLEQGMPLGIALQYGVPEMPRRTFMLAAAAERVGTLRQTLSDLLRQERREPLRDPITGGFYLVYPVILAAAVLGLIGLLQVFVTPKFEEIFRDFAIPLPAVTILTLRFISGIGPVLAVVLAILVVLLSGQALWQTLRPAHSGSTTLREVALELVGRLPGLGTVLSNRALGDVCQVLSDALDAGRPMDEAMLEAMQVEMPGTLQTKMRLWREAMQRGTPLELAARKARLPALLVGMLGTAQATADMPEVLRFLSRYYRGRFSRAMMLAQAAVVPAVVILMGFVVAAVAVSLFLPLADLADAVMPEMGWMP